MDKIFQLHKTTWDLKNLKTKLNLIENHQSVFPEEIFNSLYQTNDKDKNNNSTVTARIKTKNNEKSAQQSNENINPLQDKEKKSAVKIMDPKVDGIHTLKRKRDTKPPSAQITVESPTSDATSRKLSQTTATILVSKTKTKTGLPLLLKK